MKGKHQPHKKKEHTVLPKQQVLNKQLSDAAISEWWGRGKWKNLFAPVDISTLVFFRILFGLLMLYEVVRYVQKGWIKSYWIDPKYHFTYWPFDFLTPLPGDGMYGLFYLMGFLSVMIVLGLFYRISITLFFLCFSYMFLLEQTRYMNHFYLVILISFVMIFIPAHTSVSLDSKLFKNIRSETAPAWTLWLMRFMIGVPYFFGGVAKINTDWLQGEPLKMWLKGQTDIPVMGPLLQYDWVLYAMAYSGLFLDLLIVPALLFKKTRKWGFLAIFLFHIMNSQLFQIGIFPWFMIVASTLYFNPGWFRKFINFFTGNSWPLTVSQHAIAPEILSGKHKIILAALAVWIGIQVIAPVRHFFIPGSVHWTEEGHRYAWHMKLRTKRGTGIYTAVDKKSGQQYIVNPKDYLTTRQTRKFAGRPYLIWQFCQIVKKDFAQKGMDVAVYANVKATLNGRTYQQLIDSTVDMTSVSRPLLPVKWIVPLTTPLSDRMEKAADSYMDDGGD